MSFAITKRIVLTAEPRDRPYELRDAQVLGLILRVQPSGHKAWIVTWAHGKRRNLGSVEHLSLDQARDQARQAVAEYVQSGLPALAKSKPTSCTLEVLLDDHFEPWAVAELKGGRQYPPWPPARAETVRSARASDRRRAKMVVMAIHAASKRSYGRHRLVRALRARNHRVGHKRVARLMAEERIQGKTKGRLRRKASAGSSTLAPNLLDRKFAPGAGPTAWVGDITYVATRQGWLHLAVVISVQTRQVLGYSTSDRMTEDLVLKAFANAWALHPQLIFHSDRGGQYWGNEFRQLLQSRGVVQSMSRPGNCWDNAVAERFFATLKAEEAAEPYSSREQASQSITTYIHGFYNPARLHSALGYQSPNTYARQLKAAA